MVLCYMHNQPSFRIHEQIHTCMHEYINRRFILFVEWTDRTVTGNRRGSTVCTFVSIESHGERDIIYTSIMNSCISNEDAVELVMNGKSSSLASNRKGGVKTVDRNVKWTGILEGRANHGATGRWFKVRFEFALRDTLIIK